MKKNTDFQSQEFYSKIYGEDWLHHDSQKTADYLVKKLSVINFAKRKKILDAGCGVGILGKAFKETYKLEPYGLEINKKAVEEAKKNGVNAQYADLEKVWPSASSFYDVVVSVQVIEHIVQTDFYLTEANRVLKKGGLLIITTPNLATWFNRIIFLFGFQPFFLEVSTIDKTLGLKFTRKITTNRQPLGHVRGFTLAALCDILELHKFKTIKIMGGEVNYLPPLMNKIDKVFSRIPSLATDLIVVAEKE